MKRVLLLFLFLAPFVLHAQIITTIAGTGTGHDGTHASTASVSDPNGLVTDRFGNLYFAQNLSHVVRKIDASGIITTVAGRNTVHGGSGDGGPATAALLYEPCDVAVDTFGNVYIADGQNYKIRKFIKSRRFG